MTETGRTESIRRLCINAILRRQSPQSLLEAAYKETQIPIIAFDSTIALIAYAFPRPFYFQDWEEIVEFGACPRQKVLTNLRDYQEIIYRNRAPTVISWGTCAELPQICCPIVFRDFLYGYIGMAPAADSDMDEVSAIEELMAKALGRLLGDEQESDSLSPEQYVNHLLLRDKPDLKVLKAYENRFCPPYLLAVLMSPVINEAELQYILGHICRTQPQVIGCASESRYLSLLISGMDLEDAQLMINRHLRAAALQHDYYVSFSDIFYSISSLPFHKIQTTLTQSVNTAVSTGNHISSFADSYVDIIGYYSIEHFGKTAVLPYALHKLSEYDEQCGKNYINTLQCYMNSSMKLSLTAQLLNLHPNTVRGRLDKIADITGLDLEDYNVLTQLHIGLQIYYLLHSERFSGSDDVRKEPSDE